MQFTLLDGTNPILSKMEVFPMDTLSSANIAKLDPVISRPGIHHLVLEATPMKPTLSLDSFDASIQILYVSDQPEVRQGNFTFGWKEGDQIQLKEGEFSQRYLQIGNIDHDMGMVAAVVCNISVIILIMPCPILIF